MKRFEGTIDFEKYYGEKYYKKMQFNLVKKEFSSEDKRQMMFDIIEYIDVNNYALYHNFMDDISKNKEDWFNFLTFDKTKNKFILIYIKSKVQSEQRKNFN